MTRGRIAVIIDYKTLLMSTEFNGDMYPEYYGHGLDVYNKLLKTENETEYRGYVYEFNNDFFQHLVMFSLKILQIGFITVDKFFKCADK